MAYLVSFLAIGGAWIAHAALTDRLARTNPVFLRLKRFVLLAVLMLPFPTRLLAEWFGEREAERVAVALFGVTLLVTRLAGVALDGYARSSGRSRSGRAPSEHGWSGSRPCPAAWPRGWTQWCHRGCRMVGSEARTAVECERALIGRSPCSRCRASGGERVSHISNPGPLWARRGGAKIGVRLTPGGLWRRRWAGPRIGGVCRGSTPNRL